MKINNTLSKIKTTGAQSCSGHLQEDLLLSPQHHSHVNFRISRCGLTVEQNINADPSETNGQISDLKIRLCCSAIYYFHAGSTCTRLQIVFLLI